MTSRLETASVKLAELMNGAPLKTQETAALAVARWAVERVGFKHAAIHEALFGNGHGLGKLVEELDDIYFQLQEAKEAGQRSEAEVLAAFSAARVASAVHFFALGDYEESLYEAIIATDDPTKIKNLVSNVLIKKPA